MKTNSFELNRKQSSLKTQRNGIDFITQNRFEIDFPWVFPSSSSSLLLWERIGLCVCVWIDKLKFIQILVILFLRWVSRPFSLPSHSLWLNAKHQILIKTKYESSSDLKTHRCTNRERMCFNYTHISIDCAVFNPPFAFVKALSLVYHTKNRHEHKEFVNQFLINTSKKKKKKKKPIYIILILSSFFLPIRSPMQSKTMS